MSAIKISPDKVIELLDKGYSRTTSSKNYNPEIGSIEEYYGVNKSTVSEIFKHPSLKGKKTKKVSTEFEFVDSASEDTGGELSTVEATSPSDVEFEEETVGERPSPEMSEERF